VEGVVDDLGKARGGRDVIGDASDGDGGSSSFGILPFSQNPHQDVGGSAIVQQLTDKVQIADEGGLEDDGHVGSVKQFDGIGTLLSSIFLVLHGKDDPPSLEVNDHDKDKEGGGQIRQIG
jgi:hypothetical protein